MSESRSSDPSAARELRAADDRAGLARPPSVRDGLTAPASGGRVVEQSAGGVVVRFFGGRPHVLLIRDPYGRWGLPKGHLEDGEGSAEAALREVEEETGLADLELGADLGEIDWSFRANRILIHKFCRFYLMRSALSEARPEVSEGITECRWLPADEALRMISYENARAILALGVRRLSASSETGERPAR